MEPTVKNPKVTKRKTSVLPIVLIGGVVLAGCLLTGVAVLLILSPGLLAQGSSRTPTPPPVSPLVFPTATIEQVQPTQTIIQAEPTQASADEPTATDAPTNPPAPATTNPPAVTNPPPTNTLPPTATSQSSSAIDGLTDVRFWVDKATVAPNERISFNFSVTNSGTKDITFGYMGVTVFKDGANVHFHTSWTQWVLAPGKTETWNDGVAIGDAGVYELQLSACLPHIDTCNAGNGDWYYLGTRVTVTVTG